MVGKCYIYDYVRNAIQQDKNQYWFSMRNEFIYID